MRGAVATYGSFLMLLRTSAPITPQLLRGRHRKREERNKIKRGGEKRGGGSKEMDRREVR